MNVKKERTNIFYEKYQKLVEESENYLQKMVDHVERLYGPE